MVLVRRNVILFKSSSRSKLVCFQVVNKRWVTLRAEVHPLKPLLPRRIHTWFWTHPNRVSLALKSPLLTKWSHADVQKKVFSFSPVSLMETSSSAFWVQMFPCCSGGSTGCIVVLTLWPQPLFLHGSSLSLSPPPSLFPGLSCCFDISLVWDNVCVWNYTSSIAFQFVFASLQPNCVYWKKWCSILPPTRSLLVTRTHTSLAAPSPRLLLCLGVLALFAAFSGSLSRSLSPVSGRRSAGLSHCSYWFGSGLFSQAQRNCLFPWSTLTPGACPTSSRSVCISIHVCVGIYIRWTSPSLHVCLPAILVNS